MVKLGRLGNPFFLAASMGTLRKSTGDLPARLCSKTPEIIDMMCQQVDSKEPLRIPCSSRKRAVHNTHCKHRLKDAVFGYNIQDPTGMNIYRIHGVFLAVLEQPNT